MISKFVARKALVAAIAFSCGYQAYAEDEALPLTAEVVERPVSVLNLAERPLGSLYLNQWVQLRASGELVGNAVRLTGESYGPAENQRVYLMQSGKIVAETSTRNDGQIVFQGVAPGLYTLVARGQNSIGSFSLAVLDLTAGKHLPAEFSVPVAEIADSYIDSILSAQSISNIASFPNSGNADPVGRAREIGVTDYKAALTASGSMDGYFSRPGVSPADSGLEGANVVLFEKGREIMRTRIDANGHYRFEGLRPGVYGIVASGAPRFFVSAGFTAVAARADLSQTSSDGAVRFVSAVVEASTSLQMEGGETPVSTQTEEEDDRWALVPDVGGPVGGPMGGPIGGGFGGGGGGLGGGMFGGGGFGGLAALGALGGVAAAIAANNNDDKVIDNSPVIIQK